MVNRKRTVQQSEESEGEEFSDMSDNNSTSSTASKIVEDPIDDGWVFPIVPYKAPRGEYTAVCESIDSMLN
jgi:hypothetical protein